MGKLKRGGDSAKKKYCSTKLIDIGKMLIRINTKVVLISKLPKTIFRCTLQRTVKNINIAVVLLLKLVMLANLFILDYAALPITPPLLILTHPTYAWENAIG
jgi:hypothetical protein